MHWQTLVAPHQWDKRKEDSFESLTVLCAS
jgi:hypothetical protein